MKKTITYRVWNWITCRWMTVTTSIAKWASTPHLVITGVLVCTGITIIPPAPVVPPVGPPPFVPVVPLIPIRPPPTVFRPVVPIVDDRPPFVLPPEDVRGYPPVIIEGSPRQFPPVVIERPRMGPRETNVPEPNSAVLFLAGLAFLLLGGSLLGLTRGAFKASA